MIAVHYTHFPYYTHAISVLGSWDIVPRSAPGHETTMAVVAYVCVNTSGFPLACS